MGDSRVRARIDPAVRAFGAALLQSRGVGVLNQGEYQEELESAQNPASFVDRFWAGLQSAGPEEGVDVIMERYETALGLATREVESDLRSMGATLRSPAELRRRRAAPSAQENSTSPESLLED